MAQVTCKYHPRVPARWVCANCAIEFCSSCVKREGRNGELVLCTVCNYPVSSLGLGNVITPFWSRIPRFFIYPANPTSLTYITVLSLISAALFSPSLFGLLIQLVIFVVFLRYAYAVLDDTARGHLNPPKVTVDMVIQEIELPFKQLAVFILMGVALGFTHGMAGSALANLLLFFFVLCIPATVMVIAIQRSVFQAINPLMLVSIIKRIGLPYFILFVFLLILWGGSSVIMELVVGRIPLRLLLVISNISSMYFLLIMFNMMGYVIYQYHEQLGFHVEVDYEETDEAGVRQAAEPVDPVGNQVNILISEGKLPEAISFLQEKLKTADADIDLHDRYHKLLVIADDKEQLLEHGKRFIGMLVSQRRLKRALEIYRECSEADNGFQLDDPNLVYPLAKYGKDMGAHRLALAIMNGFAKRYPGHRDIPRVYFLAATVLCEGFKQDEKAKKMLNDLATRYPGHEIVPEIRKYLSVISGLST